MELIMKTGVAPILRLNSLDDVVIARRPLVAGEVLEQEGVTVRQPVPAGHKIAARRVEAGQPLRRYGQIIGFSTGVIEAGDHVHVHNLTMGDFARDYAFSVDVKPDKPLNDKPVFMGIVRPDVARPTVAPPRHRSNWRQTASCGTASAKTWTSTAARSPKTP
jgi:altronate hydrolase